MRRACYVVGMALAHVLAAVAALYLIAWVIG